MELNQGGLCEPGICPVNNSTIQNLRFCCINSTSWASASIPTLYLNEKDYSCNKAMTNSCSPSCPTRESTTGGAYDFSQLTKKAQLFSSCWSGFATALALRTTSFAPLETSHPGIPSTPSYKSMAASMSVAIGSGGEIIEITKNRVSETSSENAPPWNP